MTKKTFEQQKTDLINRLTDDLVKNVMRIQKHTESQCKKGDHFWESFATGGRDGHCVSKCLICGHTEEGWD